MYLCAGDVLGRQIRQKASFLPDHITGLGELNLDTTPGPRVNELQHIRTFVQDTKYIATHGGPNLKAFVLRVD